MRQMLQNYLKIDGIKHKDVAQKMGLSRETLRRWCANKELTAMVEFSLVPDSLPRIESIEISKSKMFYPISSRSEDYHD